MSMRRDEGAAAAGGPATVMTTLAVENMHCGGCMRKVEAALSAVPGVASARANLSARRATAVHSPRAASAADLVEALGRAGFRAAELADDGTDAPAKAADRTS